MTPDDIATEPIIQGRDYDWKALAQRRALEEKVLLSHAGFASGLAAVTPEEAVATMQTLEKLALATREYPRPARPSWAETFTAVAEVLSQRSTCPRLQTGAIVTDDGNRLCGAGYNGAPRGTRHCSDVGCIVHDGHCVRAVHAEQNALLQALVVYPKGTFKLYSTHRPCVVCTRLILQYDVAEVYYLHDYDSDGLRGVALGLLKEKGVRCHQLKR